MTRPTIKWSKDVPNSGEPPAVGPDGTIYFATSNDPHIHALSPSGRELWRYRYDRHFTESDVCDATIMVSSDGKPVCSWSGSSRMFVTNQVALKENGGREWQLEFEDTESLVAQAEGPDGTILFRAPEKKLRAL